MKTTDPGVNLIKTFEGFSANSYLCPARVWTIGYGHTGPEVKEGMRITEAEGQAILKKDLARFEIEEKIIEINSLIFDPEMKLKAKNMCCMNQSNWRG